MKHNLKAVLAQMFNTDKPFYAVDFEVRGDAASPTFYVIEVLPENRIDVLSPERGGIP
jgi:hypothetical protein